jgi:glycosyltransferase involved in cell wall biosynthesis/radical SAM superfamily enzyme YgiQ (UPF0313 family)/polysaccharide pyruvyl transferase WcaK-like protein
LKIALINPPFLFPVEDEITLSHCLGLRYISSYLKKGKDHDVFFIDALLQGFTHITHYANGFLVGLDSERVINLIPKDTELIGLSVPFSQLASVAHDLANKIKKKFPKSLLIMGGTYPSTQPKLALLSQTDFIVVGEGEKVISQIADGKNPRTIKGVYSREDRQKLSFPPADMIDLLDEIPFPDDSLPNMEYYYGRSPRNERRYRTASILTSRGCPFSCEFCSIHPVYGRKWRGRSPENVLMEIDYLNRIHDIHGLEIEDDNFTLKKDRTIRILEGIIHLNEKGANLSWRSPNGVRIDTIDKDIARLVKRSNCREIVVALEHGDPEMLQIMNKKLDLDKAYDVVKMLVEQQIPQITLFVIVGYPGESRKRFLRSLNYLYKIKALGRSVGVCVNIAQPYPGTQLLSRCQKEGFLPAGEDAVLENNNLVSTGHFVQITTPDFDAKEVLSRKERISNIFSAMTTRKEESDFTEINSPTVRILLLGWIYQGNTGDDLSLMVIRDELSPYGEVRIGTTEIFDPEAIEWCHLLIIGSGSHITPRGISCLKQVAYAREKDKKIVFYSQTIEEGHPLFEEHLSRADLITVRDKKSKQVIEGYGFKAVLAADPIFRKQRRLIGCSFRRWINEPPGIVKQLASILDNLVLDYDVVFLPFTPGDTDTESDTAFHEQIMAAMKNTSSQISFAQGVKEVDLLVGMRLHALIEAVNIGKPILAIDYDPKIRRIFSDLGLKNRILNYQEIGLLARVVREEIFNSDGMALREKVNEALIARICDDISKKDGPFLSIVMPTFNRAGYLKEAIESILVQTFSDWELILIDDGSVDETRSLVESYHDERIRYYNFGHNGISYARNIGSLLSRGDIIVISDSDDLNVPHRLECIVKELGQGQADILYSSMIHFKDKGEESLIKTKQFSYEMLTRGNYIFHPTVAYRREVALDCPYNEDLEMVEDYDFYLRAAHKGYRFKHIEEPLVRHRIHGGQISEIRMEEMSKIHSNLVEQEKRNRKINMLRGTPLVSIIIPTFNRTEMLLDALRSIYAQSYKHFEIIVINDGGDNVQDLIHTLNQEREILYIQHPENRGLPSARNTGLKAAKGKYIAYLDDDDIYYPDHLEVLITGLESNQCRLGYTDSVHVYQRWIGDRYVPVGKAVRYSQDFDYDKLLISNYIPVNNIMHERELLQETGLFDETLTAHEDWDLWIRCAEKTKFLHIPQITAEVRIREDGTTMTNRDRVPFLDTMKKIHARYAHQAKETWIIEDQKKTEYQLQKEIEVEGHALSAGQYQIMHRYQIANQLCRNQKVLVLGSRNGYGPYFLAHEAAEVVVLEENPSFRRKISGKYCRDNLTVVRGEGDLREKYFDIVLRIETVFDDERSLERKGLLPRPGYNNFNLKKIKSLLKWNGVFLLAGSSTSNMADIKDTFSNLFCFGQKVYPASNIFPLWGEDGQDRLKEYFIERGEGGDFFHTLERKTPGNFILVASDGSIDWTAIPLNSYQIDLSETLLLLKDECISFLQREGDERLLWVRSLERELKKIQQASEQDRVNFQRANTDLQQAITDLDRFREVNKVLQESLTAVYNSTSWKITGLLRSISAAMKKFRNKE